MPRALIVFLAVTTVANAADRAAAQDESEFQLWSAVLSTAQFKNDAPTFSFWMDVHLRRGNAGTVHIARPGIGVRLSQGVSLWGGYAWVPVYPDDVFDPRDEHRLWQQAILSHRIDALSLQSRTRFEQRFVEGGADVGFRLRQFVRGSLRLTQGAVPGVGVVVWDEVFVGLHDTDWGQFGGFDQNRLFVGPMFQLNGWARLEPGYLLVYLERGSVTRLVHAVSLNLFLSPTL